MTKTKKSENQGSTHHFTSVQSMKTYKSNRFVHKRNFPCKEN